MKNVFVLFDEVEREVVGIYFTERTISEAVSIYTETHDHSVRVETWEYESCEEGASFYEMEEHITKGD